MDFQDLSKAYKLAVHAAQIASVDAEEEAQLTTPVSNLFCELSYRAGLGKLSLVRETRLDRTRPDFAAVLTNGSITRQKGFIELKSPSVSVNAACWTGRNAKQWAQMRLEAEIVIVCNGVEAQLYRDGEPVGEIAGLPYNDTLNWDARPLIRLLSNFFELNPTPINDVASLSKRLAVRTADLRDRLLWLLEQEGEIGALAQGSLRAWQQHVYAHAGARDFADGISQVIAYGMVLAVLTVPNVDKNHDGFITIKEARSAIRQTSPVLAAAFAPLVDRAILAEAVKIELGALETLISAVNSSRVNASGDKRGDPWLFFYEDFLAIYDPVERRQAGVYYTPINVVKAMTAMTDCLLVNRFGKRLGFADNKVVILDPATGTGTFPLAVIDRAVGQAVKIRGKAGERQAASNLVNNLYSFELLPGPYSVAHLRITQRLASLLDGAIGSARVILTDTLESPLSLASQYALFGDAETLAAEQDRARQIKLDQDVTVVIGNPPYRRVERTAEGRGSGGWIIEGRVPGRQNGRSLFADIYDVANQNTVFSHMANLYNLYVYFWRWSIWKAFEAHGDGPGIVSLITGASWLTGPGFMGLRQLVREICDEVWVLDLGGDNRGAHPEENVFAIETPVAIVTLVRDGKTDKSIPAKINYRRIRGDAEEKLASLQDIAESGEPFGGEWLTAPNGWRDAFTPAVQTQEWSQMPLISQIFPWQQPGCKYGRTWPIAPVETVLQQRWDRLAAAPRAQKPDLFVTATSGRNVETKVVGLQALVDTDSSSASEPIVRYGYRSFDRQWALFDPRLAKTESPSLWQSMSESQLFFASLLTGQISDGPALTVSAYVPDLHFFRGSYGGKDIIPLYRDSSAREANITKGFLEAIARQLNIPRPTPEDIAAYVYGILSTVDFQKRFAADLTTPGLRVPITTNPELWQEVVEAGRELIWLHTYAERFGDLSADWGKSLPVLEDVSWTEPVTRIPVDMSEVNYDETEKILNIADGKLSGVRLDVWLFAVSGMPVVSKWLGYRTLRAAGRAASSKSLLDQIRPHTWPDAWNDELLDLLRILTLTCDKQNEMSVKLGRVCEGPLISHTDLPIPSKAETLPPATLREPTFDFG